MASILSSLSIAELVSASDVFCQVPLLSWSIKATLYTRLAAHLLFSLPETSHYALSTPAVSLENKLDPIPLTATFLVIFQPYKCCHWGQSINWNGFSNVQCSPVMQIISILQISTLTLFPHAYICLQTCI